MEGLDKTKNDIENKINNLQLQANNIHETIIFLKGKIEMIEEITEGKEGDA